MSKTYYNVSEIATYIRQQVINESNGKQTPSSISELRYKVCFKVKQPKASVNNADQTLKTKLMRHNAEVSSLLNAQVELKEKRHDSKLVQTKKSNENDDWKHYVFWGLFVIFLVLVGALKALKRFPWLV